VILPDVNVLIYAFRSDSAEHQKCRRWLETLINGPESYGVSPQTLCSLIRICTHHRIYAKPSRLEDAIAFSRTLLEQPNATVVQPGERHWSIFQTLCWETDCGGNMVQDAWFAALAIEWGCEWVTVDRDYARFRNLRWRPPF